MGGELLIAQDHDPQAAENCRAQMRRNQQVLACDRHPASCCLARLRRSTPYFGLQEGAHASRRGEDLTNEGVPNAGGKWGCTSSHEGFTMACPAATAYTYFSVRIALSDTTTTSAGGWQAPFSTACTARIRFVRNGLICWVHIG